MCFAPDATPPPLPSGRPPLPGERIELTSADGTRFAAYRVTPAEPNGRAVMVLPDIRGLFAFYENLAGALAAEGFEAIAIDYFGRTADDTDRGPDFDPWPHVERAETETVQADIAAAKAALGEQPVYTVGFCFGGGHSFMCAASGEGFAGVVGFYGRPYSPNQWYPSAIEVTDRMTCPVLGLFGGADNSIPLDIVGEFDAVLGDSGVEHEIHVYDGAPHSFFDRSSEQWADACTDAWTRTLAFMRA